MPTICGVDEAGRGPVIGPLVIAGAAVSDDAELREMGVRDSKVLSPGRREELDARIRKVARVHLEVITAEEIDTLRSAQSLNLIEAQVFAKVIRTLDVQTAYVDAADASEENFRREVASRAGPNVTVVAKHKADSLFPVVSAASIVAKVRRDAEVRKIAAEFGMDIGSGYPSDPTTVAFLEKWIKDHGNPPPHVRMSWKTIQRMVASARTGARTLDDY